MTPTLEIIIPVRHADARILKTAASLIAQTDRRFEVLLSDNLPRSGAEHVDEAHNKLSASGITVRRIKPPGEAKRIEHWNWVHAQAQGDWLKPLLPGETLKPMFVERFRQRIESRPQAQFVRCDAEMKTEWGVETLRAPFEEPTIAAETFIHHFPAQVEWISHAVNVAYFRRAWLAAGGFSPQLPAFASLNLNVILALHHGVENIAEPLVATECADRLPLNESAGERVNLPMELWLILRQMRNYCLSSKLQWAGQWPSARAFAAFLGRW